jgi:hypothetical protein
MSVVKARVEDHVSAHFADYYPKTRNAYYCNVLGLITVTVSDTYDHGEAPVRNINGYASSTVFIRCVISTLARMNSTKHVRFTPF